MYRYTLLILFLLLPLMQVIGQKKKEKKGDEKNSIQWMSWEEALQANQKNPKKIFVDVYTHWCGWCKKMDQSTFSDPEVISYMNENYHPVKLNAEMKQDVIMGNDTLEFKKTGRRGTHELALKLMQGRASYPTVVFLDEKLQLISPLPGYRGPDQMKPILVFFNEEHYKAQKDLNKFIKNYEEEGG